MRWVQSIRLFWLVLKISQYILFDMSHVCVIRRWNSSWDWEMWWSKCDIWRRMQSRLCSRVRVFLFSSKLIIARHVLSWMWRRHQGFGRRMWRRQLGQRRRMFWRLQSGVNEIHLFAVAMQTYNLSRACGYHAVRWCCRLANSANGLSFWNKLSFWNRVVPFCTSCGHSIPNAVRLLYWWKVSEHNTKYFHRIVLGFRL